MEQYVRDARIAQIYEGTNGVQAMDLVGRKLALGGGAVIEYFFSLILADLEAASSVTKARIVADATSEGLAALRDVTKGPGGASVDAVGDAADDYSRLFAPVPNGGVWTPMAPVA